MKIRRIYLTIFFIVEIMIGNQLLAQAKKEKTMFQEILKFIEINFEISENAKNEFVFFFNSMEKSTPKLIEKMEQVKTKYKWAQLRFVPYFEKMTE